MGKILLQYKFEHDWRIHQTLTFQVGNYVLVDSLPL